MITWSQLGYGVALLVGVISLAAAMLTAFGAGFSTDARERQRLNREALDEFLLGAMLVGAVILDCWVLRP